MKLDITVPSSTVQDSEGVRRPSTSLPLNSTTGLINLSLTCQNKDKHLLNEKQQHQQQQQQLQNVKKESQQLLSSYSPSIYLNNAEAIYPFHVDCSREDHIIHVAKVLCPGILLCSSSAHNQKMQQLLPSHHERDLSLEVSPLLSVRSLSGGLSNELFVVQNEVTRFKALVRIHPSKSKDSSASCCSYITSKIHDEDCSSSAIDEIVDREVENRVVAWLSATADAPTFYGRFCNGRVEEFYEDVEPLSYKDMIRYATDIAVLLSKLHSKKVPSNLFSSTSDNSTSIYGSIWHRGDMWLQMAKHDLKEKQQNRFKQNILKQRNTNESVASERDDDVTAISSFLDYLEQEWDWLKSTMQSRITTSRFTTTVGASFSTLNSTAGVNETNDSLTLEERVAREFCSQVVLTHMDCQSLNILRPITVSNDSMYAVNIKWDYQDERCGDVDFDDQDDSRSEASSSSATSVPSDDDDIIMKHNDAGYTSNMKNRKVMHTTVEPFVSKQLLSSRTSLRLIDYEYAAMNSRAVDIANTFCEYCDMNNLQADYERQYPSDEVQSTFLTEYMDKTVQNILMQQQLQQGNCKDYDINTSRSMCSLDQLLISIWQPTVKPIIQGNQQRTHFQIVKDSVGSSTPLQSSFSSKSQLSSSLSSSTSIACWKNNDIASTRFLSTSKKEISKSKTLLIRALQNEIGKYTLISHLSWAIWSVVQTNRSSVTDFDYMAYARLRMEGYRYFQKRFWE